MSAALLALALLSPAPGPLCNVALPEVAPVTDFAGAEALGEVAAPPEGAWVWLNVWATWCRACVAELPLLAGWSTRAGGPARLSLQLASVDVEKAPVLPFLRARGVAGSRWLPVGAARGAWLNRRGFSPALTLPLHALYDPHGRLRCVREGAVEPAHFDPLMRLMAAP